MTDVRLADVLDAICEVADHPIKYSIEDYAIVFSAKGAETPMLYSRHFRVDPNTFYQGLQSVSALSFGENNNSSGGSGGSGGSSGGSSSGGGSGGQNQGGAVVPIVNVAPGSSGLRSQGQGGGGSTSGGGGNTGGGAAGGTGIVNSSGNGGLNYITTVNRTSDVSTEARQFFSTLGVNLELPGKSLFFNDRLGELFVRASQQDLDTIENAIEVLNRVAPQVHIKARFIEIDEGNPVGARI